MTKRETLFQKFINKEISEEQYLFDLEKLENTTKEISVEGVGRNTDDKSEVYRELSVLYRQCKEHSRRLSWTYSNNILTARDRKPQTTVHANEMTHRFHTHM